MDHYQDIKILPDPEFSPPLLMGALYNKLHRALVELNATNIGVSFPEYSVKPKNMGRILRLHGSESSLSELFKLEWLKGMRDHTEITGILTVPAGTGHQRVIRRQFKTNVERLRRRRMKRKNESYNEVCEAIPDNVERKPNLPFITVRSGSTGQSFSLFIEQLKVEHSCQDGEFNSYGLSQTATLPAF